MALIFWEEAESERGGDDELQDTEISGEFSQVYNAFTDDLNDTHLVIRDSGLTPSLGDQFSPSVNLWLVGFAPVQGSRSLGSYNGSTGHWWKSTLTWSGQKPRNTDIDPVQWDAVIRVKSERRELPVIEDYQGNPLTNQAGEFYTDIKEPFPLLVYSVSKNLPVDSADPKWVDPSTFALYDGAYNSDQITIRGTLWPFGTLQMAAYEDDSIKETVLTPAATREYVPVRFDIRANPDSYARYLMNRGFMEKVYFDADGKVITDPSDLDTAASVIRRTITDEEGKPVKEEQWLDDWGRYISNPAFTPRTGTWVGGPIAPYDISLTGITLDEDRDVGRLIRLEKWGVGIQGDARTITCHITAVTSPTNCSVSVPMVGNPHVTGNATIAGDHYGKRAFTGRFLPFATLPLT